ncbi:uncharacterized protein PgNI_11966 [Pyricularia grisea]|uniref:Uncharacterized protein n=1 Tax=Pyricularia grisea TaxID=148305 RepID=A0A6P8AR14_PYRGI|nr:uncharacterized protein PgNI_11966 [Pyricularia grisea]TLD04505.1 hypothetical protein PgNI_11966 [Pyricularia grisea]
MARIAILALLVVAFVTLVASSPPTFCKCTCFKNSTIIPLGTGHVPANPPPGPQPTGTATATATATAVMPTDSPDGQKKPAVLLPRAASSSCTQCNRAFCLQYNLPICKGAEEKDVVTQCFSRDSRKDQLIVWAFILGTGGLLGWAGLKRALEHQQHRRDAAGGMGIGVPVGSVGRSGGVGASRRGGGGGGAGAGQGDRGDFVYVDGDADQGEGMSSGVRAAGR